MIFDEFSQFLALSELLSSAKTQMSPEDLNILENDLKFIFDLIQKAIPKKSSTLADFYEKRIEELEIECEKLTSAMTIISKDANVKNKSISNLEVELEKKRTENDEIYLLHEKHVEQIEKEKQKLQTQKNLAEKLLVEKDRALEIAETNFKDANTQNEFLIEKCAGLTRKVSDYRKETDELTSYLNDSKKYSESLEIRINIESKRYNDAINLLSKNPEQENAYLTLLEELKELQNLYSQTTGFFKEVWNRLQTDQQKEIQENVMRQNTSVEIGNLCKSVPFFFEVKQNSVEKNEPEESPMSVDSSKEKPPSYLKSLGVQEMDGVSEEDPDNNKLRMQLAKETETSECCSRNQDSKIKSQFFNQKTNFEINKNSLILCSQELLDEPNNKSSKNSANKNENGFLKETTFKNLLEENGFKNFELSFLEQIMQKSQTGDGGFNPAEVLRIIMNSIEMETSFCVNSSQMQSILNVSQSNDLIFASIFSIILNYIRYLEKTMKAYICWSDISACFLKNTNLQSRLLKESVLEKMSKGPIDKKAFEIIFKVQNLSLEKRILEEIKKIFNENKHKDFDFFKKIRSIAKGQMSNGQSRFYGILEKTDFFKSEFLKKN